MTEPKWTPGPWRVRYDAGPPMTDVEAGDRVLATAYPRNHTEQPSAAAILRGYAEAEANARLIAAAPDLYAAVEAQHKAIDYLLALCAANIEGFMPTENDQAWPAVVQGHAALTKARGETK